VEPDLKIFIAEDKCTNADALLLLCAGVLRWGRRRLLCVGQPDLKITEKSMSLATLILSGLLPAATARRAGMTLRPHITCTLVA
jgi:hypothetical protein